MQDLIERLEVIAPPRLATTWDNVGWQIGDPTALLTGALLTLDVTPDTVAEATALGANLIVAHHPLLFRPIHRIDLRTPLGRLINDILTARLGVYAAHTNLDAAPEGVSVALARALGLVDIAILQPIAGENAGMGAVGMLPQPRTAAELASHVRACLGLADLRVAARGPSPIRRVAVCGGSGGDLIPAAAAVAEAFVTSDVRYHRAQEAQALGLTLIDADHYATERPVLDVLATRLRGEIDVPISVSRLVTSPFLGEYEVSE